MAHRSNLIFHLNLCTSDIGCVNIPLASVLSPSSLGLLLHGLSVVAEPLGLQHCDCLVLIQVWAPPEKSSCWLRSGITVLHRERSLTDLWAWVSALCSLMRISACTREEKAC